MDQVLDTGADHCRVRYMPGTGRAARPVGFTVLCVVQDRLEHHLPEPGTCSCAKAWLGGAEIAPLL